MTTQEIVSKVKELQALIEEAQAEAETIKGAIKANMGGSDVLLAGEYKKGRNHDGTPFLHCIREVSTWITIKLS